jgi:ArsR family metal-binding transcriptional regulator
MSNLDLLEWFDEEERSVCSECGERACVTFAEAKASFCMGCGVVKVDGRAIRLR